jgi:hypothetical protein
VVLMETAVVDACRKTIFGYRPGEPGPPPFSVPGVMRVWVGESVRYQGFAQAAFAEAEAQPEP